MHPHAQRPVGVVLEEGGHLHALAAGELQGVVVVVVAVRGGERPALAVVLGDAAREVAVVDVRGRAEVPRERVVRHEVLVEVLAEDILVGDVRDPGVVPAVGDHQGLCASLGEREAGEVHLDELLAHPLHSAPGEHALLHAILVCHQALLQAALEPADLHGQEVALGEVVAGDVEDGAAEGRGPPVVQGVGERLLLGDAVAHGDGIVGHERHGDLVAVGNLDRLLARGVVLHIEGLVADVIRLNVVE
mmetsp:Transcript_50103/g.160424  ORF Transcript_50103/g.160424 Transcript_50103/m.160424 type:complete len:247 (+) Transcript_50103:5216-5956(+)